MWRVVQSFPRAVRQQWSLSTRSAPQSVHCDQDDPNGLKKAAAVHRNFLQSQLEWPISCRWASSSRDDKDDFHGDKTQSKHDWRLPHGQKGALEAVGWGTAILLGLQLSKLYHLNLSKDRRRSSGTVPTDELCPLKWIQQLTTTTPSSIFHVSGTKHSPSGGVWEVGYHGDQGLPQLATTCQEHGEGQEMDVETLLDVVYEVEKLENDFSQLIVECDASTSSTIHQELTTDTTEQITEEENARQSAKEEKEDVLSEAVTEWVNLTQRCTVMAHHRRAYAHLCSGAAAQAFRHWQEASRLAVVPGKDNIHQSSAPAHYNLALCYELGTGTTVNLELARKHYALAAACGHPASLYNLAMYCLQGLGGEREVGLAISLLEKAAQLGLEEARHTLGVLTAGQGESCVLQEAAQVYTQAAQDDDAAGVYYLGLCYAHGWGVVQDLEKASQLFSTSARKQHAGALYQLARYTEAGLGGLEADQQEALALFQKAVNAGHEESKSHVQRLTYKLNEDNFKKEVERFLDVVEGGDLGLPRTRFSPALRHASLSLYVRENLLDFGPNSVFCDHHGPSSVLEATRSKLVDEGETRHPAVHRPEGQVEEGVHIERQRQGTVHKVGRHGEGMLHDIESQSLGTKGEQRLGTGWFLGEESIEPDHKTGPDILLKGGFGDVPRRKNRKKTEVAESCSGLSVEVSRSLQSSDINRLETQVVLCS